MLLSSGTSSPKPLGHNPAPPLFSGLGLGRPLPFQDGNPCPVKTSSHALGPNPLFPHVCGSSLSVFSPVNRKEPSPNQQSQELTFLFISTSHLPFRTNNRYTVEGNSISQQLSPSQQDSQTTSAQPAASQLCPGQHDCLAALALPSWLFWGDQRCEHFLPLKTAPKSVSESVGQSARVTSPSCFFSLLHSRGSKIPSPASPFSAPHSLPRWSHP